MHNHISKVASTCFFHLRRLHQLRHVVILDVRQRLNALVLCFRVDYCNSSLAGLPAVDLAPLHLCNSSLAGLPAVDLAPLRLVSALVLCFGLITATHRWLDYLPSTLHHCILFLHWYCVSGWLLQLIAGWTTCRRPCTIVTSARCGYALCRWFSFTWLCGISAALSALASNPSTDRIQT